MLSVGLLHAIQIALQRLPLAHALGTGHGAELAAIDRDPLPSD